MRKYFIQNYIKLSRTELFEAVWKTPLVRLAEQYGISNVAIRKKCVKYKIPTPPRGYWAKKAAGHKVETPKLYMEENNPEIRIRPYWSQETKRIITASRNSIEKKVMPDKLNNPIQFVKDTKKAYKDAYKVMNDFLHITGNQKALSLNVSSSVLPWALIVYDSILKELKKYGYQLNYSRDGHYNFRVTKSNITLGLYIYERRKKTKSKEYGMNMSMSLRVCLYLKLLVILWMTLLFPKLKNMISKTN